MRIRIRLALAPVLLVAILQPVACRSAIDTWTRWEQSLTSSKPHPEKDGNVTLQVTCSGPNQENLTGLGFWTGARTFRIRCLFPRPRTWTWRTERSDTSDSGLHNQTGTVEVLPYTAPNPLYRDTLTDPWRTLDAIQFIDSPPGTVRIEDLSPTLPWQRYYRVRLQP